MEKENTEKFLAVWKDNFGTQLNSLELLIVSQIKEFQNNGLDCYVSNEQFSWMFGESISKVKRSLNKLEELGVIKRSVSFVQGNGKANRQRILYLNNRNKWKVHNEPSKSKMEGHIEPSKIEMEGHIEPSKVMEGSKTDNGRFKIEEWKVHNEPIKDKEKKNKKINNGHCVPLETTPSASSETLPSVAPAKKKNNASKNGGSSIVKKISDICCCPVDEMASIINNNGLDYSALLHCVENGYINGKNLYSKKYWESLDVDDVLRDPTYEEYLASMYKSNPDGLDGATTKKNDSIDDCLDSDDADSSWLDGFADWVAE